MRTDFKYLEKAGKPKVKDNKKKEDLIHGSSNPKGPIVSPIGKTAQVQMKSKSEVSKDDELRIEREAIEREIGDASWIKMDVFPEVVRVVSFFFFGEISRY